MAAYAALVSVLHIIDQIQHHPNPPISLDQSQVESLTANVTFLQEFLEGYSHVAGYSEEADALETRIADAAYAAENVIESHIVDQIESRFHEGSRKIITSAFDFYKSLQEVIGEMDSIMKEVKEITKEKMGVQYQLHSYLSISACSSTSPFIRHNTTMVGFDDALNEVMDKLIGLQYNLLIIPIVGMGGTGKTTLARNIYTNALVVEHFDILAWVTISQVYSAHGILVQLLCQTEKSSEKVLCEKREDDLGVKLYKYLSFRRYLVVMDDMWSVDVWDKIKFYFPNNNNGSRIMVTTRLSNLAFQLSGSYAFQMKLLDEIRSWDLFLQVVFDCPNELEDIGKKIVRKCRGLPLSIVVIGGLLTKYKGVREYWEYTLKNLSSAINLENDEGCIQILYTSYKELPIHLKPCFLYMGIFQEDEDIRVSELIRLWVAEGFLKPMNGKSLEAVAEECFKELIDRNLILVHKLSYIGKVKFCKIHDLLRDLCLREAHKQKFLCVMRPCDLNSSRCIENERRIIIHKSMSEDNYNPSEVLNALRSASLARTFIVDYMKKDVREVFGRVRPRLLRICKAEDNISVYAIDTLHNLRYFFSRNADTSLEFSSQRLWNLQILIARNVKVYKFPGIWKVPLLRHIELIDISNIPDPSHDKFVLGNLQTIKRTIISSCRENVIDRVPNIRKLKIYYEKYYSESFECFNNLGRLRKLEHLNFYFYDRPLRSALLQNLTFPHSLKKLTLENSQLHWEDMITKIGSLPLLEVLILRRCSFVGPEWVTVEGQFCRLKFLLIERLDLKYLTTDSTHFPCLEHLHLRYLRELSEIPQGVGEIPTLQSIKFDDCSRSAAISAKRIQKEQEEFGNDGLQVQVKISWPYATIGQYE